MKKSYLISFIIAVFLLIVMPISNAQAAPAFQAAGAGDGSGGNCTVAWPTHVSGDIALLFVESQSEEAVTAPAGFAQVLNSPKYTVAQTTTGTRLTVFWARATSASMPNVTITDPGDHCIAQILTYRGVVSTGDPWDVTGGDKDDTSSTSVSATGVTTSTDTLIVVAVAQGRDANSTTVFSGWTNTNLTGIAERADFARNNGNGGGFGVMDGVKATIGATGNTAATLSDAFRKAFLTIALKPPPPAGVPNKLAFLQQPTDTTAGVAITPNVTVEIQDSSSVRVNDNTTQVTISIGSNPGGGTLTGDSLTVTAVAGVATFSNLKIDQGGNEYTLIATAASLPNPTTPSNAFNIRGPSKLAFSVQPSNTIYNNTISPAVTVEIQDSLGNRVPIATNTVTIAIGANPASGTLSGTLSVSAVAGVATFSDLSINNAGGGYTLTVSSAGLTGATSDAFNITTGAYGLTQCAGSRYGEDLGCTSADVSITGIAARAGSPTSCVGGESVIFNMDVTINVGGPARWDIGIFLANDGLNPKDTPASGGSNSCSVAILPFAPPPFRNLDGDGCGDIDKPPDSGLLPIDNVLLKCTSAAGLGGNLSVPFVVSWDNQSSPAGGTCNSIANPVPNTKAKCNKPSGTLGSVSVVVLPTITKTDGKTTLSPNETTDYTVVITNTTGDTLSNALFKDPDPADPNLTITNVICTATGGAACPASYTPAAIAAGVTLPDMPNNSSVTFTITAQVIATPSATFTNTATVTVNGQTASASDTVGGSGSGSGGSRVKIIKWREVFK